MQLKNRRLNLEVTCLLDARALVGESPVWCDRDRVLYWVDIRGQALHRFEPDTCIDFVWPMPSRIGCIVLREKGGAVVALQSGFHFFDFDTGALEFIVNPEPDKPTNRLNDGQVSRDGRLFAGTMDDRPKKQPVAALYRLDPDRTCHKILDGLVCSNGLAFSPDGRTMFHGDSRLEYVNAYDYDRRDGSVRNRRVIRGPSEELGRPDGAAVDVGGFYWSCGVSAGRISCFAPDGEVVSWFEVPTAAPTMCCFGGADLKTLYITSLRRDMSDEVLTKYPTAGGLFAVRMETPGLPTMRFAG